MKILRYIVVGVFLIIMPAVSMAQSDNLPEEAEVAAEKKNLVYGGELNFASRYVWRGVAWTDGPVLQPSAWVGAYGIEFTVWSNFILYDADRRGKFDEVDLILLYSYEWNKLTIEPKFEYWMYFNQDDAPWTGELSLKLSYNIIGTINVFTFQAFDLIKYRPSYFGEFGFSFSQNFLENLSWENAVSFTWANSKFNDTYLGASKNAINYVALRSSVEYYPLDFFYIRPYVELSVLVDPDLRAQVNNPTLVSGGIAAGVDF